MDRKRAGRAITLVVIAGAIALGALLVTDARARHGHRIEGGNVPNHPGGFDFMEPPCSPAPRPAASDRHVLLRYLGVSGLYIEWRGTAVMTTPFFSNYALWKAGLGDVGWDREAIDEGLEGLEMQRVQAIFSGHGHYDHLADLPPILLGRADSATAWVNRSSANMLWAFEELRDRVEPLDDRLQEWIRLTDDDGRPLPVRFMALQSSHAPHAQGFHWAAGDVDERWKKWDGRNVRAMKEGLPLAFLIDLLADDGETVAFRIWLQDAVAQPPDGLPPDEIVAERPVDLAVLCTASYWRVKGFPEELLERTGARHAMATHYEDFFRSRDKPVRFVSFLTDKRANRFLERIAASMSRPGHRVQGPQPCGCGPCSPAFSMPLPGEWLRFDPLAGGDQAGR